MLSKRKLILSTVGALLIASPLYVASVPFLRRKGIETVSRLSRLKETKVRLIATQYRTGSGPGSPAGQPGWGGGSDRVESHCSGNSSSQQSQEFFEVGVVERLGNDQVATTTPSGLPAWGPRSASCSVIEWPRKRPHRSPCEF